MVAVRPVPGCGASGVSRQPAPAPAFVAAAIAAALVVALLAPLVSLTGVPAFWRGEFLDADCFLRLDRVRQLLEGRSWYDAVSHRTDAPFGEELHWTRPFDLPILLGAWPLSWVIGLKPALEWWGSLVSPLLLLPTFLLLQWGMTPTLGRHAIWGAVPFFLVQPQLVWVFIAGRPDHHSLLALAAAGVLVVVVRLVTGQAGTRAAAWGGAAAGLGVWVSVEGLVAAALGAGLLGLSWLLRGGVARLLAVRAYLLGFAAVLALGIAVEYPPSAWAEARYVKLSVVHLLLAGTAAAMWVVVGRFADDQGRASRRLAWCLAGAVIPAAVVGLLYPLFYQGPLALHSPEAQAWSPTVGEMASILPRDRDMAMVMLTQLGLSVVAGVFLLLRLRRDRDADRRMLATTLLLPLVVYGLAGLMQNRWSSYAQLAAVFPLLMLGRAVWRWPGALRLGASVLPLRGPVLALVYLLPLLATMLVALVLPARDQSVGQGKTCQWPQLADWLRREQPPGPGADILFTHMFAGPEVMWRSGWRVVAAPYISNTGIVDSIRVFAATDDAAAHDILKHRRAALLVVCGNDGEAREYRGEKNEYHPIVGLPPAQPGRSLHVRLLRGEAPPWLSPVALPKGFDGVRVYRVGD